MTDYLQAAIKEAKLSLSEGGIPIGAVLVHKNKIIGRGHNRRIQKNSAILHAEMDALENAQRQPPFLYKESVLYTTLSPCPMCTGAIILYNIPHVIIGENKSYQGEIELLVYRGINVEVANSEKCFMMMQKFIKANNSIWNEDIGEIESDSIELNAENNFYMETPQKTSKNQELSQSQLYA